MCVCAHMRSDAVEGHIKDGEAILSMLDIELDIELGVISKVL